MKREKLTKEKSEILYDYGFSEQIIETAVLLQYEKGEYICKEAEKIVYLQAVLSGESKVCLTTADGKTILLGFGKSGDLMGDLEIITKEIWTSNVIALTKVECVGIPLSQCKKELIQNVPFLHLLVRGLADKLDKSSRHIVMNSLYTLENRLCAYMDVVNLDGVFRENLTETAELLGTSYRHLLRTLSSLIEDGVIKRCSAREYQIEQREEIKRRAKDCFMVR